MNENIDWTKPLEGLNGCKAANTGHSNKQFFRLRFAGNDLETWVDAKGCIGGVQVVRNRPEPVKRRLQRWVRLEVDVDGSLSLGFTAKSHDKAKSAFSRKPFAIIEIDRDVEEGEGL